MGPGHPGRPRRRGSPMRAAGRVTALLVALAWAGPMQAEAAGKRDRQTPKLTVAAQTPWTGTGGATIPVSATDSKSGVAAFVARKRGSRLKVVARRCKNRRLACKRSWSTTLKLDRVKSSATFDVVAIDRAGNRSKATAVAVRVDTTPPVVTLSSTFRAWPDASGPGSYTVTPSATDTESGVVRLQVRSDNDLNPNTFQTLGALEQPCLAGGCPFSGPVAVDAASLPESGQGLIAVAIDGVGLQAETKTSILVDRSPPVFSFSEDWDKGKREFGPYDSVGFSASDGRFGGGVADLTYKVSSYPIKSATSRSDCFPKPCASGLSGSFMAGDYPDGEYQLALRATDTFGLAAERTITFTVKTP